MILDFSRDIILDKLSPKTEFEENVKIFLKEWFSGKNILYVQTSGSTGKPKNIAVEKSKMLNSAKMTCDFLQLKENSKALLCLPIEYISGKMMIVRAIYRKMRLQVVNPSVLPLDVIKNTEFGFDFCAMTPLQVENSLYELFRIKKIIIGGSSVSENLKKRISDCLTNEQTNLNQTLVYETYGMSETLSHIALKQIYPIKENYFKCLNDVKISTDERNCLKILALKINSDILQTNDIVEILDSKKFVFLGRADNIINSGGAKIFPEQLESFVKQFISKELVFVGIKDDILGQKLILVIEGDNDENIKKNALNIKFEKSFHKPKDIIFIPKIPRTPNGKISRTELIKIIEN